MPGAGGLQLRRDLCLASVQHACLSGHRGVAGGVEEATERMSSMLRHEALWALNLDFQRLLQGALTNVFKHSHASQVRVEHDELDVRSSFDGMAVVLDCSIE